MNPYGYSAEPQVPPRRKRSLSTSRTEPTHDDSFGFSNRMKRNFSTDHIPNDYLYSSAYKPVSNYYLSQQQQQSSRQPYGSAGNLLHYGQIPRLMNPVAAQVPSSKVPVRPHQDYLKYAPSASVSYNPYSPNFSPTFMARPALEPFQNMSIPTAITSAIARGRDPTLYSSKEQLNSSQANLQNRCPPERPPPPRYSSQLSIENLHSSQADLGTEYNMGGQFFDRRSVSPSRLSPTEQKAYNVRRSTSPLPSALQGRSSEQPLSRSGSRTSLNQGYRMSRDTSPFSSRSPSPLRSHPFSFATNISSDHNYQPVTRSASTSKYISRSSLLGGSPAMSSNSSAAGLLLHNNYAGNNSPMTSHTGLNRSNSVNSPSRVSSSEGSKLSNSSVNNQAMANTLQVPNGLEGTQPVNNRNANVRQMDPQFSDSFTDHCDQYKSVTSKILAKKANRTSGDFNDVNINDYADDYTEEDKAFNRKLSYSPEIANAPPMQDRFEQTDLFSPIEHVALVQNSTINSPSGEMIANSRPVENFTGGVTPHLNPPLRRNSSNGALSQQRKGSLPSDYLANCQSISLSNEWSREKVANMAHEARQRKQNPTNSTGTTFKKIGTWFTRQFIFLLIAGLNILLAYVFYNLLTMLPSD